MQIIMGYSFLLVFIFGFYLLSNLSNLTFFFRITFTVIFFLFSIYLRFLTPFDSNKDFEAYINHGVLELVSMDFLTFREPFEPIMILIINKFLTKDIINSYRILYWLNFAIITIIFIKISFFDSIPIWKKLLFFSLFYFLFSYTLLRNGLAYGVWITSIYFLKRQGKLSKQIIILPLFHNSAIFSFFIYLSTSINLNIKIRYLLVAVVSVLFYAIFLNSSFFLPINGKIEAYSNGNVDILSSGMHYFFFAFTCFLAILFLFENSDKKFLFIFICHFFVYVLFFWINPVMGYRFSIYLIAITIFLNNYKFKISFKNLSLFLIVFLMIFIFTFYSNHSF